MSLLTFYKYIIKFIGGLSLIHALAGIAFAAFSINSVNVNDFENIDFSDPQFSRHLENDQEQDKEEAMAVISKMPEIVVSFEFKAFYWCFILLGLIINLLLLFISYQLIQFNLKFIKWFIGVMLFAISYVYCAPWLIAAESESMLALQFAAAWGIGNIGLSLHLLTYFWLWAPLLVLIGVIIINNHNKSLNLTGA